MNFSDTPSVSFSDLMSTVASNFGLNTGSAEREAETAGIDIRNALSLVSNFQGVGFSDISGKPITIPAARRPTPFTSNCMRYHNNNTTTTVLLHIFGNKCTDKNNITKTTLRIHLINQR